jgi:hypothetical protein
MDNYPFKVGDLARVKAAHAAIYEPVPSNNINEATGIIVAINSDTGFFDILINNTVCEVHRRHLEIPKVQKVNFTGGLK